VTVLEWIPEQLFELMPATLAFAAFCACYLLYGRYSKKRAASGKRTRIATQLGFVSISLIGLTAFILTLPISETTKGQLLSLIGIILSAAIALSSTTFIGNAMAGIMLNSTNSFKIGGYIKVGDFGGRITERELLHIEIQSEDRNLTILPNLYLVTHPYRIIHSKGTIISVDISLGYDINRKQIEKCLTDAAVEAGLESPFVQIMGLGDFSVSYRIAGVLKEVKQRVTAQTELYKCVLDTLHDKQIEIVSPTFMNTRAQPQSSQSIPKTAHHLPEEEKLLPIESIVFDKAEEAETKESLQQKLKKIREGKDKLTLMLKTSQGNHDKQAITSRIANLENIEARVAAALTKLENS